ncbi:MAG: hypothetical protein LBR36_09630 [Bacteroidales bacterium]|jgi:hypothetical protein|nr:hypothetical protein [Bacteroidales bacterium]
MNKYKVLIITNISLLILLIICVSFTLKTYLKENVVKKEVIELLDGMIQETRENFSENFKYFEAHNYIIQSALDEFDSLTNLGQSFYSPEFIEYYKANTPFYANQTDKVFDMLKSTSKYQSQDYQLITKLIEYHFIKKIIENSGYLSFCWLESIGVNINSKKDTIQIGEEYNANFSYTGDIFNKVQYPVIVLDGDTLIAEFGSYQFKEKPNKKGLIKHKGYMTYYFPSGITKLPIEFEYYVR